MLKEAVAKAKKLQGLTSELELGNLIGVSGVTVMRWRHETSIPKPEHAQKLAELAGIDQAEFVAEMLMRSTKDEGLRRTLERFKRALAAAAGVLPALLVSIQHCILCKITAEPT